MIDTINQYFPLKCRENVACHDDGRTVIFIPLHSSSIYAVSLDEDVISTLVKIATDNNLQTKRGVIYDVALTVGGEELREPVFYMVAIKPREIPRCNDETAGKLYRMFNKYIGTAKKLFNGYIFENDDVAIMQFDGSHAYVMTILGEMALDDIAEIITRMSPEFQHKTALKTEVWRRTVIFQVYPATYPE